jgi:valyl-tRNA synthetase
MGKAALPKQYVATEVEARWLRYWQTHNYFHGDEGAAKAPYSITLPPPNVTGSLHMGHALGGTIQDILIRWRRMQGFNAMWMPGMDHAGIATQMLVERDLQNRENKSRHDLGREKFLERVWEWKEKYGGRINDQLQLMGFSLDWERARFTMDDKSSAAVREAFVQLYEEGLIYRAHRLVNWCTDCYTAVSDLEVDNDPEKGKLWELKYPVVGSDQHIIVATTRPETMLGDTGVAVHPEDERYKDLVGKMVALPLTGREIPVVADDFVDPEFGSGAVKVTPAHDFNDFECGQRCGLEALSVIDDKGNMIDPAPEKYRGMTVKEARKAVVADLEEQGLLGEVQDYEVPVARCQRSKTVIEPLLSEQWFVKTQPLAEPAIKAVERGKTKFVPELWTKTYMHWMTNIKDWCISRQLWWGHRIPAWYCDDCGAITVSRTDPDACKECNSGVIRQDQDVLDTWFSSGLWPFSTLGWPEKTAALRTFYPNSVLVTAADIIFFWVARMMMMGLKFMNKVPFRTVYLTPIVTDENGLKMSKTTGNATDPLDVVHGASLEALVDRAKAEVRADKLDKALKAIKKSHPEGIPTAGADALRFSLAAMTMPGRNIRLSMERVEGYRNFINKLWNASRFAQMNLDGFDAERFADVLGDKPTETESFSLADRWILSRLQRVAKEVDAALNAFKFSEAANALYHFIWGELCDWYIELSKPRLHAGEATDEDSETRRFVTQGTLAHVLEETLRLLHPFTPFVTEEIWQKLPKHPTLPASLMITVYPQGDDRFIDEEAEEHMALLQDVAVAIRRLRSTYNVPPSWSVPVEIRAPDDAKRAILSTHMSVVENAARVTVTLSESGDHIERSAKSIVGSDIEVVVPLKDLVDIDAELARLEKVKKKALKEIAFIEKKLNNPKFVERAPAEVVAEQRTRLEDEQTRLANLEDAIKALE